jgi:hypothetical protein
VQPVMGSSGVCIWLKSGVRKSVLCYCLRQESIPNRLDDVFAFNLLHKDCFISFVLSKRFTKIYHHLSPLHKIVIGRSLI